MPSSLRAVVLVAALFWGCSTPPPGGGSQGAGTFSGSDVAPRFSSDTVGVDAVDVSAADANATDSAPAADAAATDAAADVQDALPDDSASDGGSSDDIAADAKVDDATTADSAGDGDSVDEDVVCAAAPEQCNGVDDDCDGTTDEDTCDDNDDCTADVCSVGKCVNSALTASPCDDGDPCSVADLCKGGVCTPGESQCACQTDQDCALGDLCAGQRICDKGALPWTCKAIAGTAVVCDAGSDTPCAKNLCSSATGKCFVTAVNGASACEDGDPCTAGDACVNGLCKAGASVCECKADGDCAAKEDGDACNGTLACDQATNTCGVDPATVVSCKQDGATACKKVECQPSNGACIFVAAAMGSACDDGDPCSVGDKCVGGGCAGAAGACDCLADSDCAGKQAPAGSCGLFVCDKAKAPYQCKVDPATVVACQSDDGCTAQVCEQGTGKCVISQAPDGSLCKPGEPCAPAGKCVGGACKPAAPICDDGNSCTDDTCETATGKCSWSVSADGTPCEGGSTCTSGSCGGKLTTVTLTATADAWLEGGSSHGTAGFLILGVSGGYPHKRTLVRFDTSAIPVGAKVASAALRLWLEYWHIPGGINEVGLDRPVEVHALLRDWKESAVTSINTGLGPAWNAKYVALDDQDAVAAPAAKSTLHYPDTGWQQTEMPELVQGWVSQPATNLGMLLRATNETVKGREPRMLSRETGGAKAALRPQLVISYFGG